MDIPQETPDGVKASRAEYKRRRKKLIRQLIEKQGGIPHLAELTEHLVEKFGGAKRVASEYHKTYVSAKEGSQTRARMLEKIIDLTKLNAQLFGSVDDIDGMEDSELLALAEIYLGESLDEDTLDVTEDHNGRSAEAGGDGSERGSG